MSSCNESFFRLIALTGQAMRSYADQRLKTFDLTVEQLQLLKQLAIDAGRPQNVLCALSSKSPANITRILDRLQKKGLIVRRLNPEDRRSSLVFLTAEGDRLRTEVLSLFEGLSAELIRGISDKSQQEAFSVLEAITANIERMSERNNLEKGRS
ncbi:MAG: MarR family winged helix-turn-helix transcriptional regulator [Desulforhopalus sp.]|nr:MarR family winged helix-turn-helix transcriptional regulator [Desulforhopalus sp.]